MFGVKKLMLNGIEFPISFVAEEELEIRDDEYDRRVYVGIDQYDETKFWAFSKEENWSVAGFLDVEEAAKTACQHLLERRFQGKSGLQGFMKQIPDT